MSLGGGSPAESALLGAVPWVIAGVVLSPVLLVMPAPGSDPTVALIAHLTVLVAVGLVMADAGAGLLTRSTWFSGRSWSPLRRAIATATFLVIVPTGFVGLITLASSAAIRFSPSVQFLQLLSALDIVWAGSALMYGVWLRWGRTQARLAGAALGVACVASLWNYLRVVGFGPGGEWIVDGSRLFSLVITFDTVVALVAIGALLTGLKHGLRTGRVLSEPSTPATNRTTGS